ncbi:hypothetical protein F5146DRAFT_11062 [Armillaria mellea]|nr:hypothetical protein F5146DRAFT_11062 [Armillaria mellea]
MHMHPRVSMLWEPNVFLHDILSLETPARFPPIVWKNLIQLATASWDPKLFNVDDKFPRLLCSAVIESDILYTDIRPKQQLFASPLVVDFQHAVGYFSEIALKYMMCWLSWFDRLPGERLECRVLVASTRFMIQRVSRLNAGRDEILLLEDFINECICSQMLNTEAIWNILESVIVVTPIFSQYRIDLQNDSCPGIVLAHYRTFVQQRNLASHIHASSSAFDLLVTFTTTQWSTLDTSIRTRDVFEFLEECLQHCFRPAYDVFHQQRCLKFLTMQPVSSWSTSLLKAYVIGITVAIHPSSGDPEENETILQAIDCLHESENLFLVCSVLAMYPHTREWVFAAAGIHDIMTTLARIRPLDPAVG